MYCIMQGFCRSYMNFLFKEENGGLRCRGETIKVESSEEHT